MTATIANILSNIKTHIQEIVPQAECILYGSQARGDARPDSDWDILVLTTTPIDWKGEQRIRHHLLDVELLLEIPISITAYSKQEWHAKHWVTPLYENIQKEGIKF